MTEDRPPIGLAKLPSLQILAIYGCAAVLLVTLLLNLLRYSSNAYLSVIYPGEIDYGEGIVWQQAALLPGPQAYGDLQQFPFLVFHYPPVFHLLANAVSALGIGWLAAGRLVSLVATTAVAMLLGAIVLEMSARDANRPGQSASAWFGAIVAGLLVFSFTPIVFWSRVARVDMLAAVWELGGFYLALRALRRPGLLPIAALCFVLAVYTKQTMITGALAAFLVMLTIARWPAIRAALLALLVGGIVAITLHLVTDGGFFRHIIAYNVNPFSLTAAFIWIVRLGPQHFHPAFPAVALASAVALAIRMAGSVGHRLRPAGAMVLLYTGFATAILVTMGKSGSGSNYFIPVTCAQIILIGAAVTQLARLSPASWRMALGFGGLCLVLAAQTLLVPKYGERALVDAELHRQTDAIIARIRASPQPVLSEDMVLNMRAGKIIPWEPIIITDLSSKGLFEERKILDIIANGGLGFVVLNSTSSEKPICGLRFSDLVCAALIKAFPVVRPMGTGPLRLLLPTGS